MPDNPVGVPDTAPGSAVAEVAAVSRASASVVTTTTGALIAGDTSWPMTSRNFDGRIATGVSNFLVDIVGTSGQAERALVTAGVTTGAGAWTVTRAQEGTTAVAHTSGAIVSLVTRVQQVEPIDASKQVSFKGRTSTWRVPGRGGLVGQKIWYAHNASGSPVNVDVSKITIDYGTTAVMAVTQLPPVVKAYRFTALPTGGTALTKNQEDSGLTSKVAVTAGNDAQADGTVSATQLAIPAITVGLQAGLLAEAFAPRLITAVGFEMFDTIIFFDGEDETITLRAGEGLCIFLDYVLAAANPSTSFWTVSARHTEWRPA